MGRGTGDRNGSGIRKKNRANSMGLQWWRKLTLPRRGKKDSRLAPGPISQFQSDRLRERESSLRKAVSAARVTRKKHLAAATWDATGSVAYVTITRGASMQTMGYFEGGQQFLLPEEVLYLVDRGALDLDIDGLPASMQRAWAVTMSGCLSISLDEFLVYAHLRRTGFVVRRYEGIEGSTEAVGGEVEMEDIVSEEKEDMGNLKWKKALIPSFSVWRAGSFKRREGLQPLFHVVVFRYEDTPPNVDDVVQFSKICGKSRLKFALVDRGVVVLTDIATNATPLSERFLRRLSPERQAVARGVQEGDLTGLMAMEERMESVPKKENIKKGRIVADD